MRVFSSEPLHSLKKRLKQSLLSGKLDDLDYQESWATEEDGSLSNEPPENPETKL